MTTHLQPAYAAPAARGAVSYYADKAGRRFLQTRSLGHTKRLGELLDETAAYVVEGVTDGVEGLSWRALSHEVAVVDGLPVARYLAPVFSPSPAQLAAQARVAA